LRTAFSVAPDYVWIYGAGSAWQTDGPYGKGKVAKRFKQYAAVLQRVQAACANQHLSGKRSPWSKHELLSDSDESSPPSHARRRL
jgi:hypothetical protein